MSAETFGNGASTLTKEATAQPVVIGECCVAAPGRRAIVSKCNPPTGTWSTATIATSFTGFAACWQHSLAAKLRTSEFAKVDAAKWKTPTEFDVVARKIELTSKKI